MKPAFAVLMAALLVFLPQAAVRDPAVVEFAAGTIDLQEWMPIWSDEFSGSEIDRRRWTFDIGNGFTTEDGIYIWGWGNNELQFYTARPENARISNGHLVIEARRELYEGLPYTSAKLKTSGLFSMKYGKVEIRARVPAGKGLWPALWMLPEQNRYGTWAASGEIDIMEGHGSQPEIISGAIHYGGPWPENTYTVEEYRFPDGSTAGDFHVYTLEWESDELRWYVDGVLYHTQTDWYSRGPGASVNHPYPAPFDQPFYLIMNLAVGGTFDGNPDDTTPFPAIMEVDYVRVYRLHR
ncbi:MAG TPA: glycoside hydrolase family 16 protein [Symbiobacteriaceae bacterium]|nr:glycoside hydrolase family 16 protein [Symbiobacteriaceae bacterium]